jgi:hypothetical protein
MIIQGELEMNLNEALAIDFSKNTDEKLEILTQLSKNFQQNEPEKC